MNDLFYSVNEGVLFWIAGYTADLNTENVIKQTKSLKKNAEKFAKVAGVDQKHVTRYVALVLNNIEAEKLFTKHNIIL